MRRRIATKRSGLGVLLLLSALSLVGCKQAMYSVTAWNKTGQDLHGLTVEVSGVGLGMGALVAAGTKGHGTVSLPIPEQATVSWKEGAWCDPKKEGCHPREHSVSVGVRKWILQPKKFSGDINIVINPDWTVSVIPARREEFYRVSVKVRKASDGKALEPTAPI